MSITRNPGLNIDKFGTITYYNDNENLHREDGPAIIWDNGDKEWYVNGKCHRIDGPAIIFNNNSHEWLVNDIQYYSNRSYQEAAGISDEDMAMIVLKYGNVS